MQNVTEGHHGKSEKALDSVGTGTRSAGNHGQLLSKPPSPSGQSFVGMFT